MEQPTDAFYEYWNELVKNGSVSAFDRTEKLAIDIFYNWLFERYEITLRKGGQIRVN